MENEGIMGLPEGQAMQNQGSANQPVYVSSADSYDAALTALGMSGDDPAQAEAVRRAVRESIDELDLSPMEVSALLEILEYMSQNPGEYPQIRERLIEQGVMDDDDLPEAYDPAYLGMAIMALNEYEASGVQGAQAPMEMAPVVEGLEPMAMAEGGLADMAKYLSSKGRNGDTMLAHITPVEARFLKAMGGSGTINPETGLPEFFLKKLFKKVKKAVKKLLKNPIVRIVATIALATVLGPAAASVVGAATGTAAGVALSTTAAAASTALASTAAGAAVSAMAGEKLNAKSLLINAATSYFGAGGTIGGVNPVGKVAELAGRIPGVTPGGAVAQGIGAGVTSAGIGALAGMRGEEALGMGLQSGIMAGVQSARANAAAREAQAGMPPSTEPGAAPATAGTSTTDADFARSLGLRPEELYGTTAPGAAAPVTQQATATPTAAAAPATGSPTTADADFARSLGLQPQDLGYAAPQTTFAQRASDFFKEPSFRSFTDAFLVNPNVTESGKLARYVPGVATGLAVTGALGGFRAGEAEENPLFDPGYTGSDYIRDNPELFKGGLQPTTLTPYNPVVETPSYGLQQPTGQGSRPTGLQQPPQYAVPTLPTSPASPYMPGTMTNMPGGVPQPYNVQGLYNVPLMYPTPPRPYAEGGEVRDSAMAEINDAMYRARLAREKSIPEYLIPNPLNSLKALANLPAALKPRYPDPNTPGSYGYKPSVVPRDAFGGPGIPFRQAGYGNKYTSGFDPTAGGTYDPGSQLVTSELPGGYAKGGPADRMLRSAVQDPRAVAQMEGMLFAGPQAAQQAGMAVQALDQQGIMGVPRLNKGGQPTKFPRKNGAINGPGTGTSDSIPAMLSDGEFVFTAKAVRNAGQGSRRKGARRMYKLMKMLEGGDVRQG